MSESTKKNLAWINYAKVICMALVYFQHTMNRLSFSTLPCSASLSAWFKPFYVNVFFFISGYLLFKKYRKIQFEKLDRKSWNNQYGTPLLSNIIFKIAIPTVIFSTIVLLKYVIRNDAGNFDFRIIKDTIISPSMWFTSALTVSELILYFIFKYYRSQNFLVYSFISVFLAIIATQLTLSDFTIANDSHIPWRYKSGMIATLFFVSGGIFEKYEHLISKRHKLVKWLFLISLFLFYTISLSYYKGYIYTNVGTGKISIWGYFVVISAVLFIIYICQYFKSNRFIDYFGRHTLALYFLSGALPELVGILMMKIRHQLDWGQVISVTILSMLIACALTYLINRYAPYLLDLRLLKKK